MTRRSEQVQYQPVTEPIRTPPANVDQIFRQRRDLVPEYHRRPVRAHLLAASLFFVPVSDLPEVQQLGWRPVYPDVVFTRTLPTADLTEFSWHTETPAAAAPDFSWQPEYPDFARAKPHKFPELDYFYTSALPQLAIPDLSWDPEYPDFPARGRPRAVDEGLLAWHPDTPAAPLPDLSWRPAYPDWLIHLPRPEGVSELDPLPIPQPPAPDLIASIYPPTAPGPRRLPEYPYFSYTDISELLARDEVPSRGLYDHNRGLYHTPFLGSGEPYVVARGIRSGAFQIISDATFTNIEVGSSLTDPWSLFDPVKFALVCHHPGYYLFGASIEWAANATGERQARIRQFLPSGVVGQDIAIGSQNAVTGSLETQQNLLTFPLLMLVGWYVILQAQQTSTGNLNVTDASLWMQRFALSDPIVPT